MDPVAFALNLTAAPERKQKYIDDHEQRNLDQALKGVQVGASAFGHGTSTGANIFATKTNQDTNMAKLSQEGKQFDASMKMRETEHADWMSFGRR